MTRTRSRSLVAAAVLAIAASAGWVILAQKTAGRRNTAMNVEVKAEMTAGAFLIGQSVELQLTIRNRAGSSVQVPDPLLNEVIPAYIFTRPDNSSITVSLGSARPKGALTDPMAPPVRAMMELGPGATWSEAIPLDPLLPLTTPGVYRLKVAYTTEDERIVTSEVQFAIEPTQVTAFAAAPQAPYAREGRLSTVWSHSGPSRSALVDAVRLGRMWGNDRTGRLYAHVVHQGAPGAVHQIGVPAMFADRGMDFNNWVVWIQASKLNAQRTRAGKAEGPALPLHSFSAESLIVNPPVMDAAHNLTVFAVEGQGLESTLVRSAAKWQASGSVEPATRLWLPVSVTAARALHYRSKADQTTVFCLGRHGTDSVLLSIRVDGSKGTVAEIGRWPHQSLSGHPLAVYRTSSGKNIVAVAFAAARTGDPVKVVETAVDDAGRRVNTREHQVSLSGVDAPVWGSAAIMEKGAALLWRNGKDKLFYSIAGSVPREASVWFKSEPGPELLVSSEEVFMLGVRPDGGFGIESLTARSLAASQE